MTLAEALRAEIQRVLDEGPFTIQIAARIERLAETAKGVLAAAGSVAEAVDRVRDGQTADANSIAYSSAPETFGARLIQEIVAALPHILARPQSPESLVHALVMARIHGMTDVAAELEKKLVGYALDGERPVLAAEPEVAPVQPQLVEGKANGGTEKAAV